MNTISPKKEAPENIVQQAQEHLSSKANFINTIEQDETYDTYIGIVKKIKNKNRELGNEMDNQAPLIEKMENNVNNILIFIRSTSWIGNWQKRKIN